METGLKFTRIAAALMLLVLTAPSQAQTKETLSPLRGVCGDIFYSKFRFGSYQERAAGIDIYKKYGLANIFETESLLIRALDAGEIPKADEVTDSLIAEWEKNLRDSSNSQGKLLLLRTFAERMYQGNACRSAQAFYELLANYSAAGFGADSLDNAFIQLRLSELYLGQKKYAQSEHLSQQTAQLIQNTPKLQLPYFQLNSMARGDVFILLQDYAQAEQQYKLTLETIRSLESHENLADLLKIKKEVLKKYARSLYAQGKFEEGEIVFKSSGYHSQLSLLGPQTALTHPALSADYNKQSAENIRSLAENLIKKELANIDRALRVENVLNSINPVSISAFTEQLESLPPLQQYVVKNRLASLNTLKFTYGEILLSQKDYPAAEQQFRDLIALRPLLKNIAPSGEIFYYHRGLGYSLIYQKKHAAALPSVDTALSVLDDAFEDASHPDRVSFLKFAVSFYRESGDFEKAIGILTKLSSLASANPAKDTYEEQLSYAIQTADLSFLKGNYTVAREGYLGVLTKLESKLSRQDARVQLHARNLWVTLKKLHLDEQAAQLQTDYQLKFNQQATTPVKKGKI